MTGSRRGGRRTVTLLVLCLLVGLAVGGPETASDASSLVATEAAPAAAVVPAEAPSLVQGVVRDVGTDHLHVDIEIVWAPVMQHDVGLRSIAVTPETRFDPPEWSLDTLAPGEIVSVELAGDGHGQLRAITVTVVDPV